MKRPRILIADDHRIVAEGLRSLLEPEFELIGIVEDGRALLDAAEKLDPDVLIADISMPELNGIEAVRMLREKNRDIRIIFLTMHADAVYAASALEAGALGYVLKHSAPLELTTAIRRALRGKIYVTPLIAAELQDVQKKSSLEQRDQTTRLTRRQREVLQLLAEGRSVKEIAPILDISARTVEFHKYQIMEDLGIKTTVELVRFAIKHGIAGR